MVEKLQQLGERRGVEVLKLLGRGRWQVGKHRRNQDKTDDEGREDVKGSHQSELVQDGNVGETEHDEADGRGRVVHQGYEANFADDPRHGQHLVARFAEIVVIAREQVSAVGDTDDDDNTGNEAREQVDFVT